MNLVQFDRAFMFSYSSRPKTPAARRYQDDVPESTKSRRLQEIMSVFKQGATERNAALVGTNQIVLVEGMNLKNDEQIKGKTDGFHVCFVPREGLDADALTGKYIQVEITNATSQVLQGKFIRQVTIT
jgi:tRNA-2-methylthio-N6-dimethylallyladenosine synthase